MKSKLLAQILLSTLALSGAVGFTTIVKAQQTVPAEDVSPQAVPTESLTTSFECVTEGRNYATIARRGDRTTAPLMLWRTNEFGREYTPQNRCRIVSDRLSRAVTENGGRLTNLQLTTGRVNGLPVICYVNGGQSACNSSNLLLTLDSRNARDPNAALQNLVNFGVSGSGSPIVSFSPSGGSRPTSQKRISLERIVEQGFAEIGDDEPPVSRPKPTRRPTNNGI